MIRIGVRTAPALVLLPAALLAGAPMRAKTPDPSPPSAQAQALYWRARIAAGPDQFPLYAQLARACLDRARETHDPADLADARAAATKSLSLQESYEAELVSAQIAGFAHRFEEARRWARKAQAASVNGPLVADPLARSILVECALGLGETGEAEALIRGARPEDFWTAASVGKWLAAVGRTDEAVSAFDAARTFAEREQESGFAAWAECAAAQALLDAGRIAEAGRRLDDAGTIDGRSVLVRLHRARFEESSGHPREALRLYEEMLPDNPDPEVHRLAFVAAKEAGDREAAETHFREAEKGFEHTIAAGEIYALGPLAQLYADARVHLDRARKLADENLRYKRDRAALAAAEAVTRAAAGGGASNRD